MTSRRRTIACILLAGLIPAWSSGCRRPAYDDLYIAEMASEIRDLEDRIYEYDYEFRSLEQELIDTQEENDRLLLQLKTNGNGGDSPRSSWSGKSRSSPALPDENDDSISGPELDTPPGMFRPDASNTPKSPPNQIGGANQNEQNGVVTPPSFTPGTPIKPSDAPPTTDPLKTDPSLLTPPSIDPGVPVPPAIIPPNQPRTQGTNDLLPDPKMDISLGEIIIPQDVVNQREAFRQSGAPNPLPRNNNGMTRAIPISSVTPTGAIAVPSATPKDSRVMEIAFHPVLCRGQNQNGSPEYDGLYLVLQPKNINGEVVPHPAKITVVALDPAREGDEARVGRWEFTEAEIASRIQPLGTAAGIHLSLPWTGSRPMADRVIAFARYETADGRRLAQEHVVMLPVQDDLQAIWIPLNEAVTPTGVAPSSPRMASSTGNLNTNPLRPGLGSPSPESSSASTESSSSESSSSGAVQPASWSQPVPSSSSPR